MFSISVLLNIGLFLIVYRSRFHEAATVIEGLGASISDNTNNGGNEHQDAVNIETNQEKESAIRSFSRRFGQQQQQQQIEGKTHQPLEERHASTSGSRRRTSSGEGTNTGSHARQIPQDSKGSASHSTSAKRMKHDHNQPRTAVDGTMDHNTTTGHTNTGERHHRSSAGSVSSTGSGGSAGSHHSGRDKEQEKEKERSNRERRSSISSVAASAGSTTGASSLSSSPSPETLSLSQASSAHVNVARHAMGSGGSRSSSSFAANSQ
jgi:hypothetical protein